MSVALSQSSDLKEVLWNFSRSKNERCRLTLEDNPHFYEALPSSPEEYGPTFRRDPIKTFQHERISVLVDRKLTGRVFLETDMTRRAFGNIWCPKHAIIFKGFTLSFLSVLPLDMILSDIRGGLEGERFVAMDLKDKSNLWCVEEPPLSSAPWLVLSHDSSPTVTATPMTYPGTKLTMWDRPWREPILRMLRSQGLEINLRITTTSPSSLSDFPPSPKLHHSPTISLFQKLESIPHLQSPLHKSQHRHAIYIAESGTRSPQYPSKDSELIGQIPKSINSLSLITTSPQRRALTPSSEDIHQSFIELEPDDDDDDDAITATEHDEPISEPATPKQHPAALPPLFTDMSLQLEISEHGRTPAYQSYTPSNSEPERLNQQPDYLRILQDKFGGPGRDHGHRYSNTEDASARNSNFLESSVNTDNKSYSGRRSLETASHCLLDVLLHSSN